MHEVSTSVGSDEVLGRAKRFFAERVPQYAAFPEREGMGWLLLRGQGGEEIAMSASTVGAVTAVRASTLLFDQQVARFLSTLPPAAESAPHGVAAPAA
ncbi:MAG: hypothetical protein ABIR59_03360 [Gemmatimonadales bacterium]